MASIASRVNRQVSLLPTGVVFSLDDLSRHRGEALAIAHKLSRMAKSGEIQRVSKGRYFKPVQSVFGELRPPQNEILKHWIGPDSKYPSYITGIALYNKLGLTNQIPSVVSIAYHKDRAPVKVADLKIKFVRQHNEITRRNIPLLRILDVVKGYSRIPNKEDSIAIHWLQERIESLNDWQRNSLTDLSMKYNPGTRALLGAILEYSGYESEADRLKKTINPLSRFEINLSGSVLPNKAKWQIA